MKCVLESCPHSLLLSLVLGCHEVNKSPLVFASAMMYCATIGPKQQNQGTWTETSETMSQNKAFLLLSCLSQIFV
jgi:hypothetical protein